jgi:hypothetical protein
MKMLNLEQTADYLENANIQQTIDTGHAFIHIGKSMAGHSFVLVNDIHEHSALTESL